MVVETEGATCPACGFNEIRYRWDTRRIRGKKSILWCGLCGFGWQHPRPSVQEIKNYYHAFPPYVLQTEYEKEKGFSRRIRRLHALMESHGSLLDVGPGLGYFMKSAINDGWEVSGTDTQRSAVEYCKDHLGIEVFLGDIREFHLVEEPFDVITLWDVWEHVHDPIGFVERCIDFLKPGGILAMAVPNASGWPACLFKGNWRYVMFTHLNYFTLQYVEGMMKQRGLFLEKADHTMKVQSLIQGFVSWLPFDMDTERMFRLGRLHNIEGDRPEKKGSGSRMEKSWVNRLILAPLRRSFFKFNMVPMPAQMSDIMDLYFRKRVES